MNYDYGDLRTVDTHINRLRIKLGDKGRYIGLSAAMDTVTIPNETERPIILKG